MVSDLRSLGKIERPSLLDIGKLTAGPSLDLTDEELAYGTHRSVYELSAMPGLNDRVRAMSDRTQEKWYSRILKSFGFGTQPFVRAFAEIEHGAKGGAAPKPNWARMVGLTLAGVLGVPALLGDFIRSISDVDPVSRAWGAEIMQRRQMTPLEIGAEALGAFGTGTNLMVLQFFQTLLGLDEIAQARAPAIAAPTMISFRDVLQSYEPQMFASTESRPLGFLHDTPLLGSLVFGMDEANWGDLLGFGLDIVLDVNNFLPAAAYIKGAGALAKPVAAVAKEQKVYRIASEALDNLFKHGGAPIDLDEAGKIPEALIGQYNKKRRLMEGVNRTRRKISTGLAEFFHVGDLNDYHDAVEIVLDYKGRATEETYQIFRREAEETTRSLLDQHVVPEAGGDYSKALYHINPNAPPMEEVHWLRRGFRAGRDPVPAQAALQDFWRDHADTVFMQTRDAIAENVERPIANALRAYQANPEADLADDFFQYVKTWVEDLNGPEDAHEIFDSFIRRPEQIQHWSDTIDEALDGMAGEIAQTKPGLAKAFREFTALNEKWQRRLGQIGVEEGKIPSWVPEIFARVHTMRTWQRYMNPVDFARAAETGDLLQSMELSAEAINAIEHGRGRTGLSAAKGATPFEKRTAGQMIAAQADAEGLYDQLITAGITVGKQSGRALMIGVNDVEKLGKLSWIDSSFRQFDLVHGMRARRLFLDRMARAEGTTVQGLAERVFENVDIDWQRMADRYGVAIQQVEEEGFDIIGPGGPTLTGNLAQVLESAGRRQPGENAATWYNRLVDDFGPQAAKQIRERWDTAFWRNIMIPDSPYWGPLAERILPAELGSALLRGSGTPTNQFLRKLAGTWKGFKTRGSPSWWGRNWVSNKILMYQQFGWDVARHDFLGALRELRKQMYGAGSDDTAMRAMANYTDILHSTFGYSEVKDFYGRVAQFDGYVGGLPKQAWQMVKQSVAAINKAATFSELWDKVAIFRRYYPEYRELYKAEPNKIPERILGAIPEGVERGTTEFFEFAAAKRAAQDANKALFHYGKVPPAVNFLRGYGIVPFITFPFKALPAVFESAIQHPARFGAWGKLFDFVEEIDPHLEEYEAAEPEWMRTGGWIKLPIQDEKGKAQFLDLTYVLPWGDIAEQGSLYLSLRQPGKRVAFNPNIPFITWIAEMVTGKDLYTERDIWNKYDPIDVKFQKGLAKMAQNVLPPIMFGAGPGNKVMKELARRHPRWREMYNRIPVAGGVLDEMWMPGSEMSNLALLATTVGLKTRTFDLEKERRYRMFDVREAIQHHRDENRKLAKDFLRTDMSPSLYISKYQAEQERIKSWLDNNDFLKWMRDQYIAPSRLYGDM